MKGILWAVVQNSNLLSAILPRFEVVQCHHITLQYGVELEAWSHLVGCEFRAIATSECWNDQIQALRVTLPPTIPCINSYPHITVSHRTDIEPQAANEMLAGSHQFTPVRLIIPVKIEFHAKEFRSNNVPL